MWTSPSCFTPISTNAPKSITFLIVPVNIIPSFKSSNLSTSCLNIGFDISSRRSLPGLESSSIISVKVGSPISNSEATLAVFNSFNFALIVDIFSLSNKSCFVYPKFVNNFSTAS